jgi:Rrf2 family transcriptional repressor of oqxAB
MEFPMMNMRFPMAFQIVLCVALKGERGLKSTSAELAAGLESNPSFVRKMLIPLSERGILKSSQGRNGGVVLAKGADAITLREIYTAVLDEQKIWTPRSRDDVVGLRNSGFASLFGTVETEVEEAVAAILDKRTVADSVRQFKASHQALAQKGQLKSFAGALDWTGEVTPAS